MLDLALDFYTWRRLSRSGLSPAHAAHDFIRVPGGDFSIAIGDVSGKGMPAALLMASVRAYMHGQAHDGNAHLPSLMANLNGFVYDCSPSNRYVTFF